MDRKLLVVTVAAGVFGLGACPGPGAPCPFSTQCSDAGVLMTCYEGSGSLESRINYTNCENQALECAEVDAGVAACVLIPCPANFEPSCSGTVLVYCDPSSDTVQTVDCYDPDFNDGTCVDPQPGDGLAQCAD
jgi:hypothetical protein